MSFTLEAIPSYLFEARKSHYNTLNAVFLILCIFVGFHLLCDLVGPHSTFVPKAECVWCGELPRIFLWPPCECHPLAAPARRRSAVSAYYAADGPPDARVSCCSETQHVSSRPDCCGTHVDYFGAPCLGCSSRLWGWHDRNFLIPAFRMIYTGSRCVLLWLCWLSAFLKEAVCCGAVLQWHWKTTSKESHRQWLRGEVSRMTFIYLYHLIKSEPVGDGVIQEGRRAFQTALKYICSETVGRKAADTRHLLKKYFLHVLFSLTADLLPN